MSCRVAVALLAALASTAALLPQVAFAAPPAAATPSGAPSDPVSTARQLYDQGMAEFNMAEYTQALSLWNQAYALLEPSPTNRPTRTALAANIAEAHKRAYTISQNPEHLAEGMRGLEIRLSELAARYADDALTRSEQQDLGTRHAELKRLLNEALARGEVPSVLPYGVAGTALVSGTAPTDPAPAPLIPAASPPTDPQLLNAKAALEQDPQFRHGGGMVAGGAAMVGVGGALLISALITASAGWSLNVVTFGITPQSSRNYFVAATVLGISGGLLVAGGGVLLGFGIAEKSKAKRAVGARYGVKLAWAPLMLPRGGGLGLSGRF